MEKVLNIEQAFDVANKLREKGKTVILVGGCFDILHTGHIKFLNEAKNKANLLFLLLESDESIKKLKGDKRPVNTQKNRSIVLSALSCVDYIIPLQGVTKKEIYDKLIVQIKPAFIAITIGDKNIEKREKQCRLVNARLVKIKNFGGLSSSTYIEYI